MSASPQTQAILLLTVAFTKPALGNPEPLTPAEWGRFASWLKNQEKSPELLLTSDDPMAFLQGWSDDSITPGRVRHLLGRSGAMGLALEKWQRAGLWVMTRADPDYPARLKKRLKLEAPPLLFGCGDRGLLQRAGIAVVGSRAANQEELGDAFQLGAEIASQGFSVVSGGARGVDEAAMLGALESQGTAAGVLADSLLRAATSAKYRQGLMGKSLVLVSPFNPEAAFDAGNAMTRNKYIYCLADAAVVVTAGKESGGTWNGATENLKHGWVPLWVKEHPDSNSGNAALVQQGARWLTAGDLVVASLAFRKNPDDVRLRE
ncbi:MAG: DNA-processing protein DprA [Thermoanaerobaculia bacterium]